RRLYVAKDAGRGRVGADDDIATLARGESGRRDFVPVRFDPAGGVSPRRTAPARRRRPSAARGRPSPDRPIPPGPGRHCPALDSFPDIRTLFFIGAVNSYICALMMFGSRRLHAASRAALLWAGAPTATVGSAMAL